MTTSPLDDEILSPIFTTPEAQAVFDTTAWIERVLLVERTLANAQAKLGVIPQAAADAISALTAADFDRELLAERTSVVGFPIVGIVEQIAELAPDGLGEYAHWGATTQDIIDTVVVQQIRETFDLIETHLRSLGAELARLAEAHRGSIMLARSQGQPALPTTMGMRTAGWLSGISRHLERLDAARPRVEKLQLSGAVGTAASFGDSALELQVMVAEELGLACAEIQWHAQRDSMVEAASVVAGITVSLGKIGLDVAMSAQPEIGELSEGSSGDGAGASSTMPQKRNPIAAQQLLQNARITKGLLPLVFDSALVDSDRGIGVWQVEWFALPQILALGASAAAKADALIANLVIHPERMRSNVDGHDRVLAEAVMMSLAPDLGRQKAHHLVSQALRNHPGVRLGDALAAEGIEVDPKVLDPENYLGTTNAEIDAVLAAFERR